MASSRVVIVTGASRGIGHAVTSHLIQPSQNTRVVAVSRTVESLQALQQEYTQNRLQIYCANLTDSGAAKLAVEYAVSKWGRLDGIVVNHGAIEPVGRVADLSLEDWRGGFEVNVLSAVGLVKAALPALRESHGRIILTSSGAAVKGTAAWGPYSASKAMLNSLGRTLASEEPDVTTVAIRPGVVATQMQDTLANDHFAKMDPADAEKFMTLREEGKMLRPEQPGNVIARLALDAGRELSGKFVDWNDKELEKFQDQ